MKKIMLSSVLAAMIIIGMVLVINRSKPTSQDANKLQVVATYYPLQDFAEKVGGDKVQVTNLTPSGSEPHDYEPAPTSIAQAQKAAVFIYNGGHLEPWVEGFVADYPHTAVKASQDITLITAEDEHSDHKISDPHFWLDPVLAQKIVINIKDGFIKADPANSSYFTKNANAYIAKLVELDTDYKRGLVSCELRTVISSHDAFSYIGRRYEIEVASIAGLTPEEEPDAQRLVELSALVREKGIRYVFFENAASSQLTDTLARETGSSAIVFDPIESLSNENRQQGKDYIAVQRSNLANLRQALDCQ